MDDTTAIKEEPLSNLDVCDASSDNIHCGVNLKKDFDAPYKDRKFGLKNYPNKYDVGEYICKICVEDLILKCNDISNQTNLESKICTRCHNKNGRKFDDLGNHDEENSYICRFCSASFPDSYSFETHQIIHSIQKPVQCEVTDDSNYQEDNLETEGQRVDSPDKPFNCDFCRLTFKLKSKLNEHLRSHTGEKPYKCTSCSKMFPYASSLSTHLKSVHSDLRPYSCDVCNAKFPVKRALRQHQLSHKEKKFKCEFCNLAYSRKCHLLTHVSSVHLKMRPFVCHICNVAYPHSTTLRQHMRSHSGARPYKCSLCEKDFARKDTLNAHVKGKHKQLEVLIS